MKLRGKSNWEWGRGRIRGEGTWLGLINTLYAHRKLSKNKKIATKVQVLQSGHTQAVQNKAVGTLTAFARSICLAQNSGEVGVVLLL